MSTTPPSVSTGLASSVAPLQFTGLGAGINQNQIIAAELAPQKQQITNLQDELGSYQGLVNTVTSLQSSIMTVQQDAFGLGSPGLFSPTQTVTSSNPGLVSGTVPGGTGAVVGGYSVTVSALATAAQRTYTFTSPGSADTITIDGQQLSLAAGSSAQTLISTINSNSAMDVWATLNGSGQVVLSSRNTGVQGSNYIQVSDPGGALTEITADAQNGTNAQYTIAAGSGTPVSGSSASDTVTNAIPGVTLTLSGVTPTGSPVSVIVGQPAVSPTAIVAAVQQFVTDYNAAIDLLQKTANTPPPTPTNGQHADPFQRTLFGDMGLEGFIGQMRQSVYTPGAGLSNGMAALTDLGISGGTNAFSAASTNGELTLNTAALQAAVQSNPNGVQAVLQQFASSFSTLANAEAGPGGSLFQQLQGYTTEISTLNASINNAQQNYNHQQQAMEIQWANIEATLASLQAQSQQLSAFSSAAATTTH